MLKENTNYLIIIINSGFSDLFIIYVKITTNKPAQLHSKHKICFN